MQTGIFRGIKNGSMKIEYPTTTYRDGVLVSEARIFSYPVGSNPRRDTYFRGFGPNEGSMGFCPDLPAVGQKVAYEGPTPDGAGHLMVYVRAVT